MTLGDFFRWAESTVPEASEEVIPSISTTVLCKRDIFNEAVKEIARLTRCLPKEAKFATASGIPTYTISTNIPDFMEFREEGVWHCESSSTINWRRLIPTTIRELDQEVPTWRNNSSSDTIRNYWQDGDIMGTYYTPSFTLTNGFLAYYYALPSEMTTSTQYPFTGTTSEDKRLSVFDNVILVYYESKALGILGYKADAATKLNEFYNKCVAMKSLLSSRRDLAQSSHTRAKQYGNPFRT